MWRRILLALFIAVVPLLSGLPAPRPVLAAMTADIIVTATPEIVGAPANFTVNYISQFQTDISWTKHPKATNTIVRVKYGSPPINIADGYLVYMGGGTSCTDNSVNLDDILAVVYYAAWSENDITGYSTEYASDTIGEEEMAGIVNQLEAVATALATLDLGVLGQMSVTAIVLVLILAFLSFLALWKENAVMFMVVAGVAMMTGLYSPDIISGNYATTPLGISIGLGLITYSLLCIGWAFRLMFWKGGLI